MIVCTFDCEFFFFDLNQHDDRQELIEIRRWSLFDSISIDPLYNQGLVVRGIKTFLDSNKHTTLAVQLSNRNIMLINLESQVFS